jgi:hypothetical protein
MTDLLLSHIFLSLSRADGINPSINHCSTNQKKIPVHLPKWKRVSNISLDIQTWQKNIRERGDVKVQDKSGSSASFSGARFTKC